MNIYINILRKHIILTTFLSLCVVFMSCTSLTSKHNLWEGSKDSELRVIVNYSPNYDEFENENLITENLTRVAKSRIALILISHIRLNFPNIAQLENSDQIIQKTEETIESVKLVSKFYDSNTLRGIYETNVSVLIDYLISISR